MNIYKHLYSVFIEKGKEEGEKMKEYIHPMERARAFGLGTLANEVESSIAEYKKRGKEVAEREKVYLVAGKDFLQEILEFEKGEMGRNGMRHRMGALPRLELLEASGSIIVAWVKSEIPFPKNDDEFYQELHVFIKTLESMAERKAIKDIGKKKIANVEKLFSTLGEIALRKVHVSSLHDRC